MKPTTQNRWRADRGELYFFFVNAPLHAIEEGYWMDDMRHEAGNYYKTREDAGLWKGRPAETDGQWPETTETTTHAIHDEHASTGLNQAEALCMMSVELGTYQGAPGKLVGAACESVLRAMARLADSIAPEQPRTE